MPLAIIALCLIWLLLIAAHVVSICTGDDDES